jgi:hypothetical protein
MGDMDYWSETDLCAFCAGWIPSDLVLMQDGTGQADYLLDGGSRRRVDLGLLSGDQWLGAPTELPPWPGSMRT